MEGKDSCLHCELAVGSEDYLTCVKCKKIVHSKCLNRRGTPGNLFGDIFFDFTCIKCSATKREIFQRQRIPWWLLIVLAIYNLSIQSKGLSRFGYFHWRTHIAHFINKNWNFLFPGTVKQKKNWLGTIAGTLSYNNRRLFLSGQDVFHNSGWWKLCSDDPPKYYAELHEKILEQKQLRREKQQPGVGNDSDTLSESDKKESDKINEIMGEFSYKIPSYSKNKTSAKSFSAEILSDTHSIRNKKARIDENELTKYINYDSTKDFCSAYDIETENLVKKDNNYSYTNDSSDSIESSDQKYQPKIIRVTNFQEIKKNNDELSTAFNIKQEQSIYIENNQNDKLNQEFNCPMSLFNAQLSRPQPWLGKKNEGEIKSEQDDRNQDYNSTIQQMTAYEEKALLKDLQEIFTFEEKHDLEIPPYIKRLYRKLINRNYKRISSLRSLNLDRFGLKRLQHPKNFNIIDRYHNLILSNAEIESSLHVRIVGQVQYELFQSPHTYRNLHPFIFRDTKCFPLWMQLMCELKHKVNKDSPTRASIDYVYVRPHHIAAANGLLQRMFWKGIDMSECLSYPDFTVIALYKKLLVGCAFMVPDVGHNEAYISFMLVRPGWQRCGIASFMLYHLTQTCMGRDITLHVAASNSAICLYQKFGFKIEEVILDFYDKYLPAESTQSRHALFLRLAR